MKKAQIFAQPFIIIFALIVAVLVLIFGFNAVLKIQDKAKYAELLTAQEEIKNVAKSYYTLGRDSERTLNLKVPKNIECFCFRGSQNNQPLFNCGEDEFELQDRISRSSDKHLFTTPEGAYPITSFKIIDQLIPVNDETLCIPIVNSVFKAKITSQGTHVEISSA